MFFYFKKMSERFVCVKNVLKLDRTYFKIGLEKGYKVVFEFCHFSYKFNYLKLNMKQNNLDK